MLHKRKGEEEKGGSQPMKAIVLSRDRVIKIRYNEDDKLNELLEALITVPGMELIDRGYRG